MRATVKAGKLWGKIYITAVFTLTPLGSVVIPEGRRLHAIESDGSGDVDVQIQIGGTWRVLNDTTVSAWDGAGANIPTMGTHPLVSDGTNLRIYNSHAGNTYNANYYVYSVQEAEL